MDFRLRVFIEVAKALSFSKAARSLPLSQPAVSKHIKEIEQKYRIRLFERQGNRIALTPAGREFLSYAEQIVNLYNDLENHFLLQQQELPNYVKLGASTTIAQYIVPHLLADFKQRYPETNFTLINDNSATIEEKIFNNRLDFGLIEGRNHNPLLQYEKFLDDELVLVTRAGNASQQIKLSQLTQLPLVLREEGSGTRAILEARLNSEGLSPKKLQVDMILGSTESIKTYLLYTQCYAFVSIFSIIEELKHNKLQIVDIDDVSFSRPLYFVSKQGYQSMFYDLIKRFFKRSYNQKL